MTRQECSLSGTVIFGLTTAFLTILIGLSGAPSTAPKDPHSNPVDVQLDNGVRIIATTSTARDVTVWLRVAAGSLDERPHERGAAHFLEHMAFNGTQNFAPGELHEKFVALGLTPGVHVNAITHLTETTYQFTIPADNPEAIALVIQAIEDIAIGPDLTLAEVEKERAVIQQERREREELDDNTLNQLMGAWFGAGAEAPTIGSENAINALTPQILRAFHQRNYHAANLTLLVAGEVSQILPELRRRLGALPASKEGAKRTPLLAVEPQPHIMTQDAKAAETELLLTRVAGDKDDLTAQISLQVFQNRMQHLQRDGQSPFAVVICHAEHFLDLGRVDFIGVTGPHHKAQEMRLRLAAEWDRLQQEGPTAAELEKAIRDLKQRAQEEFRAASRENSSDQLKLMHRDLMIHGHVRDAEARLNEQMEGLAAISIQSVNDWLQACGHREEWIKMTVTSTNEADALDDVWPKITEADMQQLPEVPEPAQSQLSEDREPIPHWAANLTFDRPDSRQHTWTPADGLHIRQWNIDAEAGRFRVEVRWLGGLQLETDSTRGYTDLAAFALRQLSTDDSSGLQAFAESHQLEVQARSDLDALVLSITGPVDSSSAAWTLIHHLIEHATIPQQDHRLWMEEEAALAASSGVNGRATAEVRRLLYGDDIRRETPSHEQRANLNLTEATRWMKRHLQKAPLDITIAGDFPDDLPLRKAAAEIIGKASPEARAPLAQAPAFALRVHQVQTIVTKSEGQEPSILHVLLPGAGQQQADAWAASEVMARVLHNRLHRVLREDKGLIYHLMVQHVTTHVSPDNGVIVVRTMLREDDIPAAIKRIHVEVDQLRSSGPSDEEVQAALAQVHEEQDRMDRHLMSWIQKLRHPNTLAAMRALDRVNREALKQLSLRWHESKVSHRLTQVLETVRDESNGWIHHRKPWLELDWNDLVAFSCRREGEFLEPKPASERSSSV